MFPSLKALMRIVLSSEKDRVSTKCFPGSVTEIHAPASAANANNATRTIQAYGIRQLGNVSFTASEMWCYQEAQAQAATGIVAEATMPVIAIIPIGVAAAVPD
jgi:hypothetical protein